MFPRFTQCFERKSRTPWNFSFYLAPLYYVGLLIRYGFVAACSRRVRVVATGTGCVPVCLGSSCVSQCNPACVHRILLPVRIAIVVLGLLLFAIIFALSLCAGPERRLVSPLPVALGIHACAQLGILS